MKAFNRFLKKHIQIICLLTLVLTSCNYLDVVPPETADLKDTMKDREAALEFLYSCYAGIPSLFTDALYQYYNSSDEFALPPLWVKDAQKVSWNEVSPTNTVGPWNTCYNNLGQCHIFLKELDELNPNGVTEDDKVRWKAEVKFCEAFYHFTLLNAYGPIPLVTKYYSQNTATSDFPGRSPYDVCVDSISNWFDEAAENLPATVQEDELGRATSTACKALKARLLVYAASPLWNGSFPYSSWKNKDGQELVSHTYDANKWKRALEACNDAITWATTQGERSLFNLATSESIRNNENVPLPTIDNVDSTFKERVMLMRYLMTTTEDEGNKETIFGVIATTSTWYDNIRASIPHAVTKYNGSPVGGYGGISPYLYTVEHFYTIDGRLPEEDSTFPKQSDWFTSAKLSNSNIIKLNVDREPRFYAWLGYDGGEYSSFLSDGSPLVIQARVSSQQGYNPDLYNRDNNVTGYFSKKWVQPNIKWRSSDNGNNISIPPYPIIRLAELYLDRAECYAALGQTDQALADLNVVRERAGISDLTTADVSSKMTIMDWVRNERFVELWGEGQRYFDLCRWCLAPEYLKAGTRMGLNAMEKKDPSFTEFNTPTKVNQPFQWSNRMYLLPIANSELYSDPQLVQAPGY
ncbi:starch-binding protein [Segatella asaccharophila]